MTKTVHRTPAGNLYRVVGGDLQVPHRPGSFGTVTPDGWAIVDGNEPWDPHRDAEAIAEFLDGREAKA